MLLRLFDEEPDGFVGVLCVEFDAVAGSLFGEFFVAQCGSVAADWVDSGCGGNSCQLDVGGDILRDDRRFSLRFQSSAAVLPFHSGVHGSAARDE